MGNKNKRPIHGVGINDANYSVEKRIKYKDESGRVRNKLLWRCPFYACWRGMLARVYSPTQQKHLSSRRYLGCSVCEEWHLFSNFRAWMETQDWEGKELDKDLLVQGNKVYGPDKCIFLTREINAFINTSLTLTGKCKPGVYWNKAEQKYKAQISDKSLPSGCRPLGTFTNEDDAYMAYRVAKFKMACELAAMQTDERIAKSLINRFML